MPNDATPSVAVHRLRLDQPVPVLLLRCDCSAKKLLLLLRWNPVDSLVSRFLPRVDGRRLI
jgi:hypothetical protein